jgi:hypothetical protein
MCNEIKQRAKVNLDGKQNSKGRLNLVVGHHERSRTRTAKEYVIKCSSRSCTSNKLLRRGKHAAPPGRENTEGSDESCHAVVTAISVPWTWIEYTSLSLARAASHHLPITSITTSCKTTGSIWSSGAFTSSPSPPSAPSSQKCTNQPTVASSCSHISPSQSSLISKTWVALQLGPVDWYCSIAKGRSMGFSVKGRLQIDGSNGTTARHETPAFTVIVLIALDYTVLEYITSTRNRYIMCKF